MALNLIDAAKSLFTNELISKASSHLGESESGISKAISGIVPTVFSGLLSKTNSQEGANAVTQMVKEQNNTGILGNLGSAFSSGNSDMLNKGAGMLGGLFGNKSDLISSLISNFAGVKSSSASSLLSMALPAVLALIGKHASGLEPGAISSLLNSQKDNIKAAIPSGLNLGSVFGNIGDSASRIVSGAKTNVSNYTNETVKSTGSSTRWLVPVLLLLAAIAVYFLFMKGCNKTPEVVSNGTDTLKTTSSTNVDVNKAVASKVGTYDSLTNEFIYNLGNMVTIDLPNGAGKLEVGENSTENRLYKFLSDPNSVIDTAKGNWFEFTNVKFKTGSADVTDESMTQLKNLVAISKAFPTAKFKLGGYTDNTGDAAANIALSQKRADAVAAILKKSGAAAKSIEGAKGYGSEFPVADNATPEGRAQNRRVAVNVKSK